MSKKINISDLIPDNKNFNTHTPHGMDLLNKSVDKVGVIESITVSSDNKIISGNARNEVISKKFEGKEPIVIETDGQAPIILKRTDIKSDTKQFHEAALLANTVAKQNINLDLDRIEEVAVNEYDIDIEDLGVVPEVIPEQQEETGGQLGIFPLSIILNAKEYKDFQMYKKENRIKTDTEAFKQLFKYKEVVE